MQPYKAQNLDEMISQKKEAPQDIRGKHFCIISFTCRCVSSLKTWEIKDLPLTLFLQVLQPEILWSVLVITSHARPCFVFLFKRKTRKWLQQKFVLVAKIYILLTFLRHKHTQIKGEHLNDVWGANLKESPTWNCLSPYKMLIGITNLMAVRPTKDDVQSQCLGQWTSMAQVSTHPASCRF